jgi:hypothetical protein
MLGAILSPERECVNMTIVHFFEKFRDRFPDLGIRACVRTLVSPNPALFTGEP